jgi:hypothetical protein
MQRLAFALVAATLVVVACRDTSAPDSPRLVTDATQSSPPPLRGESFAEGDTWSAEFNIDPAGTVITSGIHSVRFPANSVCDPAVSSYGPGEWDKPCSPLTTALRLHVDVTFTGGRHIVKFTPDVRFVPTTDSASMVFLTVDAPAVKTADNLRRYAIFWTGASGVTVDEGAIDPSLRTIVSRSEGKLFRRLKHFSGYNVIMGFTSPVCDPLTAIGGCPEGEVIVKP